MPEIRHLQRSVAGCGFKDRGSPLKSETSSNTIDPWPGLTNHWRVVYPKESETILLSTVKLNTRANPDDLG